MLTGVAPVDISLAGRVNVSAGSTVMETELERQSQRLTHLGCEGAARIAEQRFA